MMRELAPVKVMLADQPGPSGPIWPASEPLKVRTSPTSDSELVKTQLSDGLELLTRELLQASAAMGRSLGTYDSPSSYARPSSAAQPLEEVVQLPAAPAKSTAVGISRHGRRGHGARRRTAERTGRAAAQSRPAAGCQGCGLDLRTVLLCNLPTNSTRDGIVHFLDYHCLKGAYDLVFLPVDSNGRSMGKAVICFGRHEAATSFMATFHNLTEAPFSPATPCQVFWSEGDQRVEEHVKSMRGCLGSLPEEHQPALFRDGCRVPFF